MLLASFIWFLSSLGISIFFNNVEARLTGEGIVGGDLAEEGQFPYQVLLESSGYICGGAIISKKHILTAAHCVIDKDGFFEIILNVKVGIIDGNECTNKYQVKRIYVPWQYTPKGVHEKRFNVTYDIAVLKISEELDLSSESGLQALKLPQGRVVNNKISYPSYAGQTAVLSGYGVNVMNLTRDENGKPKENGISDRRLRFAETIVMENKDCQKLYEDEGKINPAILCAQIKRRDEANRGACSADSGGPLVINDIIIGVLVASPFGCDEREKPASYSRVGFFINFIENAVNDENLAGMRVAEWSFQYEIIDESLHSPNASQYWKPKY